MPLTQARKRPTDQAYWTPLTRSSPRWGRSSPPRSFRNRANEFGARPCPRYVSRMEELQERYDTLLTYAASWKTEVTNAALEVINAEAEEYEGAVNRLLDACLKGGTHIREGK
jgi:hypothetical protein